MGGILDQLKNFRWLLDLLDIFLVAFIIYRIILLIKGTRAVQMLLGLAVVLIVYVASQLAGLYTLHWLLDNFLSSIILVIVVIFQNDIRRALIHVGRNPFFADLSFKEEDEVIDELVKACVNMANKKIGALIVIERETGINDFLEIGVEIDARVSSDLIGSIFLPYSPIHDGALVIQQGRLKRAGCFLPLSQNPDISQVPGHPAPRRHRPDRAGRCGGHRRLGGDRQNFGRGRRPDHPGSRLHRAQTGGQAPARTARHAAARNGRPCSKA